MKFLILLESCSSWRLIAVCLVSAAIIAGCGSSGSTVAGVGTGGTGSLAKTITGNVADGYLVNSTVFLDRNGNYQLDAGEPATTTGVNGAYTLNVDTTDMGRCPVVALAIKGVTIDRDTNQSVTNSYLLSMPKESVSSTANNFISPISSLIREMMETGNHDSIQHASEDLRSKMGLPAGTGMMDDYIATNNTTMHTTAQNMTTLMGSQMGQVLGTNGSTITVDVNRYRGMMGAIYSNMSTIREANNQTEMSNLSNTMTTGLTSMPPTPMGQPYWNMSTAYGNMMGGMGGGQGN